MCCILQSELPFTFLWVVCKNCTSHCSCVWIPVCVCSHISFSYASLPFGYFFLFCLFFCLFFRAMPVPYGGSQVSSPIGAVATGLHHSHSHAGSEQRLWPTTTACLTHWARPGIEPVSSWMPVVMRTFKIYYLTNFCEFIQNIFIEKLGYGWFCCRY